MKRLFTFGCSFTNYCWPTWADILATQYNQYQFSENWGRAGGGNQYIFNSVVECITRNKLSSDDHVIVMWTSANREDRYVRGEWIGAGNIYNQAIYDKSFIKNFTDERGYLIRDLAAIQATKYILEHLNISHDFLSMLPLTKSDLNNLTMDIENVTDVLDLYKDTVASIKPSVFEIVFKNDWTSRPIISLDQQDSQLKNFYNRIKGTSWPSFEKFINKDFNGIEPKIVAELKDPRWDIDLQKKHFERRDLHPIPGEHLEYLQFIYPELVFDQKTLDWVDEWDTYVKEYFKMCIKEKIPQGEPGYYTKYTNERKMPQWNRSPIDRL